MSTGLLTQLQSYYSQIDEAQNPIRPHEVTALVDSPVRELPIPTPAHPRRRWQRAVAAAAAGVVLVGGVALLFRLTEPDTPVVGTVVPTTLAESTPTTVAESDLTGLSGCDTASTWTRVCDDTAGFDRAVMWSVTAGGPGLVAVGGEDFYFYSPEDIHPVDVSGGDADAAVWTSPDKATWSRVPHDEAVFGGAGEQQMFSVTAGGPGLVAVGFDGTLDNEEGNAAVWTSPDGITWSRVPQDEAVFGGEGEQRMLSVSVGGPGLVAVGFDWPADNVGADAAVWTSVDGFTWSRVPHDEAVFGGDLEQKMLGVTAGGPGLVAVGTDGDLEERDKTATSRRETDAAVWTSPDGFTWSRVPHDETVFGGESEQRMLSVTAGGPGLVAVGSVSDEIRTDNQHENQDAAVWTSPDGITWSRVPHDRTVFAVSDCRGLCDGEEGPTGQELMRSVIAGGPGLVAVGSSGFDQLGWDEAVWTSPDGITWTRLPQANTPTNGYVRMFGVTIGGSGLVAVGREAGGEYLVAAVWDD